MRVLRVNWREEPYRVFFPLGVLAGIWGVMMWPLLYAGHLGFYPGEAHNRMMIEGFLGAFMAGFLGTAFPRLSGNKPWFRGEFAALLVLWLLAVASHGCGRVAAGDAAFGAFLVVLVLGLAGRAIRGNSDTPPPGFVLALVGLIGGALAAFALSRGGWSAPTTAFARLFLFQGFPLLPVMGIAPYLLPRFFGLPSSHSFDESPTPPRGWWKRFYLSLGAGAVILTGFVLETGGHAMAGQLIRAGMVAIWFGSETPVFRFALKTSTPGNAARWAATGMISGLVCAAFWPFSRVGSLHLFFVGGLGLLTLAVGARVVLGHAGRHDLLQNRILWLRWVVALLVLAALTRMTSDFFPRVLVSHHIYAAWSWAVGCGIWLVASARFLLAGGDDDPPATLASSGHS